MLPDRPAPDERPPPPEALPCELPPELPIREPMRPALFGRPLGLGRPHAGFPSSPIRCPLAVVRMLSVG